ncbi:MAG: DUF1800 family protein, partial [Mycobacterium sp.]
MWTRSLAVLLLLVAIADRPEAGAPAPVDDEAIIHALNRLTFGPRPGDVARVKAMGVQHWIDLQLNPSRIDDAAVVAKLARLVTLTLDSQTIQREYSGPARVERRQRQQQSGGPVAADRPGGGREPSAAQRKDRQIIADLEEAKLLRAVYGERQLQEVLVDFWFNHFNVFAGKGATRNYLGEY